MSGVTITINATEAELGRAFDRLLKQTGNLTPAMKNIGEALQASTKQRFSDEQAPDGSAWQANAAATLLTKRNPKILQEHGEQGGLLGTIAYRADNKGVELGTPKEYGAIHQFGGQAGRGHKVEMPARPYLGLSDDDMAEVGEIVEDHILGF